MAAPGAGTTATGYQLEYGRQAHIGFWFYWTVTAAQSQNEGLHMHVGGIMCTSHHVRISPCPEADNQSGVGTYHSIVAHSGIPNMSNGLTMVKWFIGVMQSPGPEQKKRLRIL